VRLQVATGMFGLFGMPYLVAVQLQQQLSKIGINISFIIIMICGIAGLLTIGFLYDKLGFLEKEQGYILQRNSEWQK